MVQQEPFKITENHFLPISAIVLIHLKLREKSLRGPSTTSFAAFANTLRQHLIRVYQIPESEDEWLQEMIMSDESAMEVLQLRMEGKLFDTEIERDIATQKLLSHLLLVLLTSLNSESGTTGYPKYDSRLRSLLKDICKSLWRNSKKSIPFVISMVESEYLFQMASNQEGEEGIVERDVSKNSLSKGLTIAASVVAGGLLVGLTGGLAVPFIAGGLSTIGVTGAGLAGFTSIGGAAVFGTSLGVAGASVAGYKTNRHFNLEEFHFTSLTPSISKTSMASTIAISGWIKSVDDAANQWEHLTDVNPLMDISLLHFDRQSLIELTTAAEEFLKSNLLGYGVYGAAVAATGTLAVAVSLPLTALQSLAMIDNPWQLTLSKAETAGIILARSVLAKPLSKPVQLIGHGMGARVIVYCLLELIRIRDEEGLEIYGLIESVYLFGGCVSLSPAEWETLISIPSSRFVNCFSVNDWFLKVLFRLNLHPAAGSGKIGVQNCTDVDCSSLIMGHADYIDKFQELIAAVGFEKQI